MKSIKIFSILGLLIALLSCSSDNDGGGNNLTNFRSQICNNVVGPTAAYWDYANAMPIPLTQVPILKNTNGQFIHSQLPYLGFPLPQGYNANEITIPQTQTIGVNVIRNDNAVVWRYVPSTTVAANLSVNDIIATEINQMFNFYGFNGNFDVLCTQTKSANQSGGIVTDFTARLIRFGNFTGLVWINATRVQGLATSFASVSISSGPTNEYNNLVMETFLPLSFQLLVNDRDSLSDRDGDGTPDIYDSKPDDPKVQ